MLHSVEVDLGGGRTITLETGKMAKQANGSVIVRSGESVVLVTACSNPEPKPGANFFPLTVDYREYTYSAGRFPGGFIKREGRMSEKETLTCRLIDRPIRPLFPEGYSNETQVIGLVLSADPAARSLHARHRRRGRGAGHFRYSVRACAGRRARRHGGRQADRESHLRRNQSLQDQHCGRGHRRRHRDGGIRRPAGHRRGSAGRHRVRPRLLQEDLPRASRS